jgi:GntR family transcriptional regulator
MTDLTAAPARSLPPHEALRTVAAVPARIDRRSPLPLWAQVLDDLRSRLATGELTERFPTDRELMDTYGVSRHTVRDAVRRLQEEGLLERERGRGTFVRPTAIEQPLGALYSLFRSIEDQGYEQRSDVLALELRTDAHAAELLEIPADEPLVYLQRLRCADRHPIAIDCSWMPASFASPLLEVDFERTALYQELAERCGVVPVSGWERIRPALPTPEQRRLLGLGVDDAVFSIERLASDGRRPVELRHSAVRGDGYSFVARWGSGEAGGTHLEPDPRR